MFRLMGNADAHLAFINSLQKILLLKWCLFIFGSVLMKISSFNQRGVSWQENWTKLHFLWVMCWKFLLSFFWTKLPFTEGKGKRYFASFQWQTWGMQQKDVQSRNVTIQNYFESFFSPAEDVICLENGGLQTPVCGDNLKRRIYFLKIRCDRIAVNWVLGSRKWALVLCELCC